MALKAKYIDASGNVSKDVDVSDSVFGKVVKEHLLFEAVIRERACKRQGTAKTKTRAEVRGGGKKPYRQKGTGNARRGTLRTPLAPGGGITFGPQPRSYSYSMLRKVKRQALNSALSQKYAEGKLYIFEDFVGSKPSTKIVVKAFKNLNSGSVLVVDLNNEILARSVRNIRDAKYVDVSGINVFDIAKYDKLFLSIKSLGHLEQRLVS